MLEVIRYVLTFYILHLVGQLKANLFIMADYFQCNLSVSINQINDFFFCMNKETTTFMVTTMCVLVGVRI